MGFRFGGLAVVLGFLCWNGSEWVFVGRSCCCAWVFVLERIVSGFSFGRVLVLCLEFCVGTDLSGFSFWRACCCAWKFVLERI